MVSIGSLVDVLFWDAFQKKMIDGDRLKSVQTSLVGLAGTRVEPMGTIYLILTMGEEPRRVSVDTNWFVVGSSYNAILGRPSLTAFRAAIFPC